MKKSAFLLVIVFFISAVFACRDPLPERNEYEKSGSTFYNQNNEQRYQSTNDAVLSGFSVHTGTASYENARSLIKSGTSVPKSGVKIEEFINYFDYDFAAPDDGAPFGIYAGGGGSPWNAQTRYMYFALQAKKADNISRRNFVFLVDVSGSMIDHSKLPLIKNVLLGYSANFTAEDSISLITYSDQSNIAVSGANGGDISQFTAAVESLRATGTGTNADNPLERAYSEAAGKKIDGGNNRIIVMSDGDMTITSSNVAEFAAQKFSSTGIKLSYLSFGQFGVENELLKETAAAGGGNHYFINDLRYGLRALDGETMDGRTVADDVKITVEFNDYLIQAFRLVGYDKNALIDSIDSSVTDADELYYGQQIVAVYEYIPFDSAYYPTNERIYYTRPDSSNLGENLAKISVTYKQHGAEVTETVEKAFTNKFTNYIQTAFITAVTESAMLLRKSYYQAQGQYKNCISRIKDSALTLADPVKQEFLSLLETLAG